MRQPSSPSITALHRVVLLTGFDPFGGQLINSSWEAVQVLHRHTILGHRIVAAQLPTVFDQSCDVLSALLRKHHPTLVLCVGQAGGRNAIALEQVAINLSDTPIPDNAGVQPIDKAVIPAGPAAYFTSLPVKLIARALLSEGIQAELSLSAGTFVCNHVFYSLMHALTTQSSLKRTCGGFVHVPHLPTQGAPSMVLTEIVRGLKLAVHVALEHRKQTF